jgi:hypothetical protein
LPTFVVIMRGPNPLDARPILASEDPVVVAAVLAAIKNELPPPTDPPDPRDVPPRRGRVTR